MLARRDGLGGGIALHGIGGELVDVGEDRLGQQAGRGGVDPGSFARFCGPAPGQARSDAVGGLERVEAAAGSHLTRPQRAVDRRPGGPWLRTLDQ